MNVPLVFLALLNSIIEIFLCNGQKLFQTRDDSAAKVPKNEL